MTARIPPFSPVNMSNHYSKFIVPRLLKSEVSPTLRISQLSKSLDRVYKLGFGQSPFPVPAIMQTALRSSTFQKDYLPVQGLASLQDAIQTYLRDVAGIHRENHVMIGPGSKELLFILQVCLNGEILLPAPSWVSYAPQAMLTNRVVHWIPTYPRDNWVLTAENLDATLTEMTQKSGSTPAKLPILVLNYPSNPHGGIPSNTQLQEIAAVARKHKILILSDEIYGLLDHSEFEVSETGELANYRSVAKYYPEGTVISDGVSKAFGAGGWRCGYMAFPDEMKDLVKAMSSVASETFSAVSAPIQFAVVEAYRDLTRPEGHEMYAYLNASKKILRAVARRSLDELVGNCSDVKVCRSEGGFYMFPDFSDSRLAKSGKLGGEDVFRRVLEDTNVAVLGAEHFGVDEDWACRVAFVDFDGNFALERFWASFEGAIPTDAAIDQGALDAFVDVTCPRVVSGCRKLAVYMDSV